MKNGIFDKIDSGRGIFDKTNSIKVGLLGANSVVDVIAVEDVVTSPLTALFRLSVTGQ